MIATIHAADPFAFAAALSEALRRAKKRSQQKKTTGDSAERRYWLRHFPAPPTPEGLRRHAQRFGAECVQEIADAYGVDLTATTEARTPKRLSAGKSKRATQLALRALIPEEVA
jgi:hypothetical protein